MERTMQRSRFAEEQITHALKLAEQGTPAKDVGREFGLTGAAEFT